jgi:hypothetical protein
MHNRADFLKKNIIYTSFSRVWRADHDNMYVLISCRQRCKGENLKKLERCKQSEKTFI